MKPDFNGMYEKVKNQLNETFNPEYFDVGDLDAIHKPLGDLENPTFTFKRYNYQGQRLYVKLPLTTFPDGTKEVGSEVLDWGMGVTGVISKNERGEDKEGLIRWMTDLRSKGIDVESYVKERADFGTIFHIAVDYLLKGNDFHLDTFEKDIINIIMKEGLMSQFRALYILDNYKTHIYNALIGFSNWAKKVNLTPIATELVVNGKGYAVASPIDILAEIDYPTKVKVTVPSGEFYKRDTKTAKKGDPKMVDRTVEVTQRKIVIVDLKTGTNSYNSHLYQLMFCREMLKETYGIEAEHIINWHPKADMSKVGVVKDWDVNMYREEWFKIMKYSCRLSLTQKFENGIKIVDPETTQKVISMSGEFKETIQDDFEIDGDFLEFKDGTRVNWKEIINSEK